MKRLAELRVRAEIESVRTVSFFLQGIAQRIPLDEKTLFDIDLASEEAVVNIVNHAYPDQVDGEILIEIDLDEERHMLYFNLTDWGIPLDPADVVPYDLSAPIETRIEGGMGLHLIQNLMDEVDRKVTPLGQPNMLTLGKRIAPLHPGAQPQSIARELNAMLTISRIMVTGIGLDQLLDQIITTLVDVVEAERGTLYLIDEARDELYSHILLSDTGGIQEIRLSIGQGIAGEVARIRQTINVQDAYADPRFAQAFDKLSGFRTRNILAAPMIDHEQNIIGVVQLLNKIDGTFTLRDERLLSAMAAQAAISIENSRLHEQDVARKLVERELDTARSIQTSFLPDANPQHPRWDFASFWLPMREVGGDFYDFHYLADNRLAFVVADVSDKGVPAAMFMAMCVTVIRFALTLGLSPVDLLAQANRMIIAEQRSRMFATAFLGFLDLETGEMTYASAGHNPPILYHARTGKCDYLTVHGVALGAFAEARYSQAEVTMQPDDILLLFTDGITEAINAEEEEFGEGRLETILQNNSQLNSHHLVDTVVQGVSEFSNNRGHDDETLVVIKRL